MKTEVTVIKTAKDTYQVDTQTLDQISGKRILISETLKRHEIRERIGIYDNAIN